MIVTGTGRSGTGYMAKLLTKCGLSIGHEKKFTPYGVKQSKFEHDSSWLAVPHIKEPTVLILRHPLKVVKSLYDIGFFAEDNQYVEFVRTYTPYTLKYESELDECLAHWIVWNMQAEAKADLMFRLEDLDLDDVNQILALAESKPVDSLPKIGMVNRKLDYKTRDIELSWSKFDPTLARLAQDMAKQWGYDD